jgi:hypothetical protein
MYPLPNLHARRLETTAVAHMTECYIMINGPLFLSNSLGTFGNPAVARLFLFGGRWSEVEVVVVIDNAM